MFLSTSTRVLKKIQSECEVTKLVEFARPFKCPKCYASMISGEEEFTQILSTFILQQIAIISKVYTKIHNFIKIP